jgi:hypothetical protein
MRVPGAHNRQIGARLVRCPALQALHTDSAFWALMRFRGLSIDSLLWQLYSGQGLEFLGHGVLKAGSFAAGFGGHSR